jgi:hypothetical protein
MNARASSLAGWRSALPGGGLDPDCAQGTPALTAGHPGCLLLTTIVFLDDSAFFVTPVELDLVEALPAGIDPLSLGTLHIGPHVQAVSNLLGTPADLTAPSNARTPGRSTIGPWCGKIESR